ncbi:MAG: hypothetical protein ACREHD_08510 [Pirellulales bacterium]
MGAAFFISLELPIDGIDPLATNGEALARCCDELDAVAEEWGVTPLGGLVSVSPDEVQDMLDLGGVGPDELAGLPEELQEALGEGLDEINNAFSALETQVAEHGLPPEEWFEASEGLQTVQRLLAFLRTTQDRIAKPEGVVGELEELEQILKAAEQAGVRFHLSVDI